jgi:hypothetical protein
MYLSLNALLAGSALFARSSSRAPGRKLRLARLALLSCVVAPFVVSFVRPTHGPVIPTSVGLDEAPAPAQAAERELRESGESAVGSPSEPTAAWPLDPRLVAVLILLAGCSLRLVALARDVRSVRRLVARAQPLRRLGRVRLVVSEECGIPFSVRLFRTAHIVLPAPMLGDPRAVAIAVAHEAQHHRQGDCVLAHAVEILRAACFWNPGVRRWRRVLSELQEFSCDEALIGRRRFTPYEYGRCLFEVARAAIPRAASRRGIACAPGMTRQGRGEPQSLLLRRIDMLSGYASSAVVRSSWLRGVVAATLVVVPFGAALAARGTVADSRLDVPDASDVDPRIQKIAQEEVSAALTRLKARSAAALVMDPVSGHVLAFAEERADETRESWATRVFTPASTVKPFILAGALEAGVATESTVYDCRQPLEVAGQPFNNWSPKFKTLAVTDAIVSSVNVCLIRVAQDAGSDATRATLARFGIEPRWESGVSDALQLARAAIGETEPVTIAQLTRAFAMLANLGHMPSAYGTEPAISESTARAVRRMMIEVVRRGTGRQAAIPGVDVAGKTGTNGTAGDDERGPLLASFGGFVPAEKPAYVAYVVVEDGRGADGGKIGGGAAAAPVFREIMRRTLGGGR